MTHHLRRVRPVWRGRSLPAGNYQCKAALNDSLARTTASTRYRAAQHPLTLPQAATSSSTTTKTHWITDNYGTPIPVAVGDFQSELAAGDWQPDCLRSWLEDPDRNGIATFDDRAPGKLVPGEGRQRGWVENYGAGGAPNEDNIRSRSPPTTPRSRSATTRRPTS